MTTSTRKTTTTATATKATPKQTPFDKVAGLPTKSAKIRALAAAGLSRSEIAKGLGIRYQHVRNVLITPLVGDKTKTQ